MKRGTLPSEATTDGIKVSVKPRYVEARSRPEQNAYFFAYEVTIEDGMTPAEDRGSTSDQQRDALRGEDLRHVTSAHPHTDEVPEQHHAHDLHDR